MKVVYNIWQNISSMASKYYSCSSKDRKEEPVISLCYKLISYENVYVTFRKGDVHF